MPIIASVFDNFFGLCSWLYSSGVIINPLLTVDEDASLLIID